MKLSQVSLLAGVLVLILYSVWVVLEVFVSAFSLQEVQIFSEHKVMEVIGVCLTCQLVHAVVYYYSLLFHVFYP